MPINIKSNRGFQEKTPYNLVSPHTVRCVEHQTVWRLTGLYGKDDYAILRDNIRLEAVAEALIGEPNKREGSRLLWRCPFHNDSNPSFQIDLNRQRWRCWACSIGGDAADLVQAIKKIDFPAAVRFLRDSFGRVPSSKGKPSTVAATVKPPRMPQDEPSGLPLGINVSRLGEHQEALGTSRERGP
jgi:hypothetical protein